MHKTLLDHDTSVTTEGANRESHSVSMYELYASIKFSCSGEGIDCSKLIQLTG